MPHHNIPMDYYHGQHGNPHLHMHAEAHYIEPDYIANEVDDQLPSLSTIGRGPRGKGVTAQVTESTEDSFRFDIVSDWDGEAVLHSPNLHPGKVWITQPSHEPVAGEVSHATFHIRRGNSVTEYTVNIAPGAEGSRIYTYPDTLDISNSHVYRVPMDKLMIDGHNAFDGKPVPRPNDIVLCVAKDKDGIWFISGTVEAAENGQVVFYGLTMMGIPIPTVGSDGYWYIDGEKTGFKAQGPKGDKGDKGDTGPQGERGRDGATGARGPKGEPGRDGKDGKDGEQGPQGEKGDPGNGFDLQYGYYTIAQLPDYNDTKVGTAYVVDDGDGRKDLYFRGPLPIAAEDGGPWVVFEDVEGAPGHQYWPVIEDGLLSFESDDPDWVAPDPVRIEMPNLPLSVEQGGTGNPTGEADEDNPGLVPPVGEEGQVLTIKDGKAEWADAKGGSADTSELEVKVENLQSDLDDLEAKIDEIPEYDIVTVDADGLAPMLPASDGDSKFLAGDGTWKEMGIPDIDTSNLATKDELKQLKDKVDEIPDVDTSNLATKDELDDLNQQIIEQIDQKIQDIPDPDQLIEWTGKIQDIDATGVYKLIGSPSDAPSGNQNVTYTRDAVIIASISERSKSFFYIGFAYKDYSNFSDFYYGTHDPNNDYIMWEAILTSDNYDSYMRIATVANNGLMPKLPSASGNQQTTQFLRGDGKWATINIPDTGGIEYDVADSDKDGLVPQVPDDPDDPGAVRHYLLGRDSSARATWKEIGLESFTGNMPTKEGQVLTYKGNETVWEDGLEIEAVTESEIDEIFK